MACPYFYPTRRLLAWMEAPLLPLGDPYEGVCRAVAGQDWQPGEVAVRNWCNMGYARGECPRFPQNGSPDAIRFAVGRADGDGVEIHYTLESHHAPAGDGVVTYSGGSIEDCPDPLLRRQAEAYAASYLRRKP
ncbi:MAG: hypothetical protein HYR60_29815 [Acidobacteria bacterium]|nr:hypothetical protein [Acidobacteriota bacterium]MBI3470731.1 hypothetical protein [Candidatus Solibacter usitatus]